MRILLATVMVVYGLIHVTGFAKAFGYASIPQLSIPIARPMGLCWLTVTVFLLTAGAALWAAPHVFWLLAAAGFVLSQLAIFGSWGDVRWLTIANAIVLGAVVYGAYAWGPFGLRAEYRQLASRGLANSNTRAAPVITELDLAPLPAPVQRYLRFVGAPGQPRVQFFSAHMSGRIRGAADAPWMPFTAEQYSFFDPPRRFFFMQARRGGLPLDGLHAYAKDGASMRIKLLSMFPVVNMAGSALTRTETVTLLNDMAIMAPSALIDPAIQWRPIDDLQAEAIFRQGEHEIRAVLVFDTSGALVNFWSDDRPALAADGVTLQPQRWSTPIGAYRLQGNYRLASRGEARYKAPGGEYAYLEFDGIEVAIGNALSGSR